MQQLISIIVVIVLIVVVYMLITGTYFGINEYFSSKASNASATAKYKITFVSEWGKDKNMINAPPNPHTGNMYLNVNNGKTTLFKEGKYASKGISITSMYGTIDDLLAATQNDPNIKKIYTDNVLVVPGKRSFNIEADTTNHYLSFVTMIAPSSDLFTGVSEFDLLKDNKWKTKMVIPLFVLKAGTDSGTAFTTKHYLKPNPDVITVRKDKFIYPDNKPKPIAFLVIEKI